MTDDTTSTTTASMANGATYGDLYIDTADDTFNRVLLVGGSGSNSSVSGTTGMTTFGKQLVYDNGASLLSEFWGQKIAMTNDVPVFAIHWNSNNEYRSGAVPVVLKTLGPSS